MGAGTMSDVVDDCPLTARELECVGWLAAGKIDVEQAEIMGITKYTVRRLLQNARIRAGVVNGPALVAMALRKGWME